MSNKLKRIKIMFKTESEEHNVNPPNDILLIVLFNFIRSAIIKYIAIEYNIISCNNTVLIFILIK